MSGVVTVGRTRYYTVRKGAHFYRVAEGRRLDDADHSWQVLKDQNSGKPFYVNNASVRRWHLPDLFQTEAEREEELKELAARRSRATGAAGAEERSGSQPEDTGPDLDADGRPIVDFPRRDQQALALRPVREWENPEARREAIKVAKAALLPLHTQGRLDRALFTAVISTACHEFFASGRYAKLDVTGKAALEASVTQYAEERIKEKDAEAAYRRQNKELLAKVGRLDRLRKEAVSTAQKATESETQLKEEVFDLRAHKQKVMLASFKRLTRAGLVQTYWERWKVFKGVIEAQLDVKARERRTMLLRQENQELHETNSTLRKRVEELKRRVENQQGVDVVNAFVGRLGKELRHRTFGLWRRWARDAHQRRELCELQDQIMRCARCEQVKVDLSRVRAQLQEAHALFKQQSVELVEARQLAARHASQLEEQRGLQTVLEAATNDAREAAASITARTQGATGQARKQQARIDELEALVGELRFQVMAVSDFSGAQRAAPVPHPASAGAPAEEHAPRGIGEFFAAESRQGASRVRSLVVDRAARAAENAGRSGQDRPVQPRRGVLEADTGRAIAPAVHGLPPGPAVDEVGTPERRRYHDAAVPPPPSESPPESLVYRADSDDGSDWSRSPSTAPTEAAPEDTEGKCAKCGFRRELTPFCPRDGSRHMFRALAPTGASSVAPPRVDPTTYTLEAGRAKGTETSRIATLPQGLPPQSTLGASLRQAASADPRTFDASAVDRILRRPVAAAPVADTADLRAMAEYVRHTKVAADAVVREQRSGTHAPAPAAAPPAASPPPARGGWQGVFDTHDVLGGSLGLGVSSAAADFGVRRGTDPADPMADAARREEQRVLLQHRRTPNFARR